MPSFRPLQLLRDLAPTVDALEYQASPPLTAGQVVYAYDGETCGLVPAGHAAVTRRPGQPWFTVPDDAIKEIS